MSSDNNPNKRWRIALPLALLMIVVFVVRRQQQELNEARRIETIRAYPSNVEKGMDVSVVDRALGPGERYEVRGEVVRVWHVPGTGKGPFRKGTIVATIKDGKVYRTSMYGGPLDEHMERMMVESHVGATPSAQPVNLAKLERGITVEEAQQIMGNTGNRKIGSDEIWWHFVDADGKHGTLRVWVKDGKVASTQILR